MTRVRFRPLALAAFAAGALVAGPLAALPAGATPTITQDAPTAGVAVSGYQMADQLAATVSGVVCDPTPQNPSCTYPVAYAVTSTLPAGVTVSSTGAIAVANSAATGNDTLSGTDTSSGASGTWTYTLSVDSTASGTLTQTGAPSATIVAGQAYSTQLAVTGATGLVSFYPTSSLPSGLTVSASGSLQATSALAAGTYPVSGYASDPHGDVGNWTFTLTAQAPTITQVAPTSGSTTAGVAGSFQLTTTGQSGAETFTATSSLPAGVAVSSSGVVTTSATTTPAGSYTISGTDADANGDVGTWSFALTVTGAGAALTQVAPTSGSTPAGTHATFQMATTGQSGTETFSTTSSLPAGVTVSSTGLVTVAATAAPVSATLTGTVADSFGDTGTWTFALSVTAVITQSSPTSGTAVSGTAASFTLATGDTNPVTFTATSTLPTGVSVSSAGVITTSLTTPAGVYTISGTDSDTTGSTGTWTFALTVAKAITQSAPTSGSTTAGTAGTVQLVTTGQSGTETFTATSSLPTGITVSSTGLVSVAATAPAGTYTVSGTDADASGDAGTWTLAITVKARGLALTVPALTATTSAGVAYAGQLTATLAGGATTGTLTFTTTSTASALSVSSTGALSLASTVTPGSYSASGTVTDAFGDTGTWSATVTVTGAKNVLTVSTPPSTVHVGATWSPTATVTSNGTIIVTSTTTKVCTVASGGAIDFVAPGTCKLTFTSAATGTYAAANSVTDTVTVAGTSTGKGSGQGSGIQVPTTQITPAAARIIEAAARAARARPGSTIVLEWRLTPGHSAHETALFVRAVHLRLIRDLRALHSAHRILVRHVGGRGQVVTMVVHPVKKK